MDYKIVENGNCTLCGKKLEGNRLFVCEECSERMQKQDCEFLELCLESYGDKIDRTKCECEKCDHYSAFEDGKHISLDAAWDG